MTVKDAIKRDEQTLIVELCELAPENQSTKTLQSAADHLAKQGADRLDHAIVQLRETYAAVVFARVRNKMVGTPISEIAQKVLKQRLGIAESHLYQAQKILKSIDGKN